MKNSELRIAELSDIHLGHPNTPTDHILATLRRAFPNNEQTEALDLIFIAGDVFDRQLQLPDEAVYEIRLWIIHFLAMCKRFDIVVRVLEGTPSHDWKQSKLFTHLNDIANIGADVEYFNLLTIEHIDRFGIDVLYIPDEWRPTCEETWHEVVAALRFRELDQVDFVVMHGAFPHQLPKATHGKLEMHDPERYLGITRHYVFVGHIHLYSQYERILAAGSFDRISHGEESPKGHLRLIVRDNGVDDIQFIPNPFAKIYLTIVCEGLDEYEAPAKIERAVKRLPEGSFVRLRCRKTDVAMTLVSHYTLNWPQFRWSVKEVSLKTKEDAVILTDNRSQLSTIRITKDNISALLLARVHAKQPTLTARCEKLLQETLNECRTP